VWQQGQVEDKLLHAVNVLDVSTHPSVGTTLQAVEGDEFSQ